MSAGVLIAGGGLAAQRAAQRLRTGGYDGSIRVLCGEPEPPYDRPPLSKELLAGRKSAAELALRPPAWYEANEVDLLLDERAEALDPGARRVRLESGGDLAYDQLLIASGARPRALALLEGYENVHALRTLADALALGAALKPGALLAVVGGGFIGLEVASTALALGVEVTAIEAASAPLASILGPVLGTWFAELHRKEGIDFRCDARLERVQAAGGRVRALQLAGGEWIACDAVLVGVGVAPAAEWLAGSGLDPSGVKADSRGRTAIPAIYAAGDVARPFDPARGAHVRSEHWEGAVRQATAAADAMLGAPAARAPQPSFWSDQHGVRIQLVGEPVDAERIELDGDPAARDFSATFLRHGRPAAVLLVGRPRALPEARRLLSAPETERTAA